MTTKTLGIALLLLIVLAASPSVAGTSYSVEAESGLGYDSNAFLAPTKDYFDPFQGEIIKPDKKSGVFIPLGIDAEYVFGPERIKLESSFDFEGKRYLKDELGNADTYQAEIESGVEFLLKKKKGYRDTFYLGPNISYNKQIYFDRDTGQERLTRTTEEDLADRFEYLRYGLETKLRMRTLPIRYSLQADLRKYDYQEVPILSSLDYTYYRLGGEAEFDISRSTEIEVSVDYFGRDFEDTRARGLDGDLVDGTDRKYSYYQLGTALQQEIGRDWKVYFYYDYLARDDEHVGYNDYSRNRYRVRSRYNDEVDRTLDIEFTYWDRNYPNAFAFDDPDFSRKSYITREVEIEGGIPFSKSWKFLMTYEYINQNSSDPRFDYERHLFLIGLGYRL